MYEEKLKQLWSQNDYLKQQLHKEYLLTEQQEDKISTFEQQLKDLKLTYSSSSFSKFTEEEFKQLACKVHDQFYQGMVNLYKGFNQMQELYNSFEH